MTKKVLISIGIVLLVLILDQWLKVHIKTTMTLAEEFAVLGDWFYIHFTENPGMAFGWKFGGDTGKFILTSFRIVAVGAIIWYMILQIKSGAKMGLLVFISLILAGAVGNIIDSLFYGILFGPSTYSSVAEFMPAAGGYANLMHGRVVDMLYFPIIEAHYPDWFPFWGGDPFIFFRPVFNIADASISGGIIGMVLFQKRLFNHTTEEPKLETDNED